MKKMPKRKITEKQKKFVDFYLKSGNLTEAYGLAYNKQGKSYCSSEAKKTINKPLVQAYLQKRSEMLAKKSIADIQEVMEFYTDVMRNIEKDRNFDGKEITVSISDRLKAAAELVKRLEVIEQAQKGNKPIRVEFVARTESDIPDDYEEWSE